MRKAQAKKLPLAPDPKFNDKLVTRFVNNLMWEGKKSGAYTIFYDALDKVTKQTSEDGYEVWKKALGNITPGVLKYAAVVSVELLFRFLLKFVRTEKFH